MKPAQKITFNPEPIGFHSETKVYYKDVYVGRIVFNDMGLLEYHEKGSSSLRHMIKYEEFNDQDKIKKYVIKRILAQEKMKKEMIELTLKSLTSKGKEFIGRFKKTNIIYRKNFTSEEKAVADYFVIQNILQKGTIDNSVVYYTKNPVSKLI